MHGLKCTCKPPCTHLSFLHCIFVPACSECILVTKSHLHASFRVSFVQLLQITTILTKVLEALAVQGRQSLLIPACRWRHFGRLTISCETLAFLSAALSRRRHKRSSTREHYESKCPQHQNQHNTLQEEMKIIDCNLQRKADCERRACCFEIRTGARRYLCSRIKTALRRPIASSEAFATG